MGWQYFQLSGIIGMVTKNVMMLEYNAVIAWMDGLVLNQIRAQKQPS
jgi:hypothetical protein